MKGWPAIVTVPLRAAPVLAATLNPTVPLPVPVAPDVTVIHAAFDVAVHPHAEPAVTATVPVPPLAPTDSLAGAIAKPHTAPPWLTVKVCPAIVSVPLRAALLFAATLNRTAPFPVPDAPDVTVMKAAFEVAVQLHEGPAVTATVPVPPPAATDWLAGEIEKLQLAAA